MIMITAPACGSHVGAAHRKSWFLVAAKAKLLTLWLLNGCGGGGDWDSGVITPPTDQEIAAIDALMTAVAQKTVDALWADEIAGAFIALVQSMGGVTEA